MVHKKYTWKKGKRYGPYLYENKRVGEKVVSTYLGKTKEGGVGFFLLYSVLVLIVLASALFVFYPEAFSFISPTERYTLDFLSSSEILGPGELIRGAVTIGADLKIPEGSELVVTVVEEDGKVSDEVVISLSTDSDEVEVVLEGEDDEDVEEPIFDFFGEEPESETTIIFPTVLFDLEIGFLELSPEESEDDEQSEDDVVIENGDLIFSLSEPSGTRSSGTNIPIEFEVIGSETVCSYSVETSSGTEVIADTALPNCADSSFSLSDDGSYSFILRASDSVSSDSAVSSFVIDSAMEELPPGEGELGEGPITIPVGGESCVDFGCSGSQICVDEVCVECAGDSDCSSGFCLQNSCVECRSSSDCGTNEICVIPGNSCVYSLPGESGTYSIGTGSIGAAESEGLDGGFIIGGVTFDLGVDKVIVSGATSFGNPFVFELEEGEIAELVLDSIREKNGDSLSADILVAEIEGRTVRVSTEYSIEGVIGNDINVDLGNSGLVARKSATLRGELRRFDGVILAIGVWPITVEKLSHTAITLNEKVTWTRRIPVNDTGNITIELPGSAEDILITKIPNLAGLTPTSGEVEDEGNQTETNQTIGILGNVSIEGEDNRTDSNDTRLSPIMKIPESEEGEESIDVTPEEEPATEVRDADTNAPTGTIRSFTTGFAVLDKKPEAGVVEVEIKVNSFIDSIIKIRYSTPAPRVTKTEKISKGLSVTITGVPDIVYNNVEAFVDVSSLRITDPSRIKIVSEGESFEIDRVTDEDGIIDMVWWTIPALDGEATFDIIIEITGALHLDSNRSFISDIFLNVSLLDGNWSETISEGEYVRVTFEKNLTSVNDITVYPRNVSGAPRIEIYEFQGTEVIATFESLVDEEYNKVLLTNLVGEQDVFDLLILNGSVEFDHIIDPWSAAIFDKRREINVTNVGNTVLYNFPVYLNISKEVDMRDDFRDIRFVNGSCDSTETLVLPYELENYTASVASIWLRVPNLLVGNTSVCMFYSGDGILDEENSTGVWNSSHVMVQHLEETVGEHNDSTWFGNNGTANNELDQDGIGIVDGADKFDGVNDYISVPDSNSLDLGSEFTISAWVNISSSSNKTGRILSKAKLNTNDVTIDSINKDMNFFGEVGSDFFGSSVGSGDFNNDGIDDLIVGAKEEGVNDEGRVYIFFGPVNDVAGLSASKANVTFNGIDPEDRAGTAVGSGDFNNDGVDDVIIGAETAEPPTNNSLADGGEAYILYGSFDHGEDISLSTANIKFYGPQEPLAKDFLGSGVGSGDFNNDGVDDVVIGARGDDTDESGTQENEGSVYIVYGPTTSYVPTSSGFYHLEKMADAIYLGIEGKSDNAFGVSDEAGSAVGSGDFNNDSVDDLIVGAYTAGSAPPFTLSPGKSFILHGPLGTGGASISLSTFDVKFDSFIPNERAGSAIGSGDFNNDGNDDLIIGASGSSKAYITYGPLDFGSPKTFDLVDSNITFTSSGNDKIGSGVGSGDFNNDGVDDIVLGGDTADEGLTDNGEAYLFYGPHQLIENYGLMINRKGKAVASFTDSLKGVSVQSSTPLIPDYFNYLAATFANGEFKIYLNGEESDSITTTDTLNTNAFDLFMGSFDSSSDFFNGTMDEVRIENVARSADWINQTYQQLFKGFSIGEEEDRPSIELTACGTLGLKGNTYILQDNIPPTTGTCFTITANSITLDGAGFSITGEGISGTGVTATGFSNLMIENLNINGFISGINLNSGSNSSILNNNITSNEFFGVNLVNNLGTTMFGNNVSNNKVIGISVSGFNNSIVNNIVNSCTDFECVGINMASGSSDNLLADNVVENNIYGIFINSISFRNMFLNNNITGNAVQEISDGSGTSSNYLVYNNNLGEIRWTDNSTGGFLRNMDVDGDIGLGMNITILDNFVELNAETFGAGAGINSSANITLKGTPGAGITNPVILRDGQFICNETTSPSCHNFTALNASTVVFNVSSWSSYSIGDGDDKTPPNINFTFPTPANNSFQNNTDIYVNLSTSDVSEHYAFVDLDKKLGLWMRFDDVNGSGDPTDLSSYSNNGTLVGGTFINSSGRFGNGTHFDGMAGSYITTSSPVITGKEVTFGGWVKWGSFGTGGGGDDVVMQQANSFDEGYEMFSSGGATNRVSCWDGIGNSPLSPNLSIGEWYHTICRYNITSITLFVNGTEVSSGFTSGGTVVSENFFIGGGVPQDFYWFNGSVDEVVVFNRALTNNEISSLYNASATQYENNLTGFRPGVKTIKGYAVDVFGQLNSTEERTITIDDRLSPEISFIPPTPSNGSAQTSQDIIVNLSTTDDSLHYAFTDFDRDLVLWMRMDDVDGSSVTDLSSYSNNGTAIGGVSSGEGYWGDGFDFDGANDYINITNSPSVDISGDEMTLALWIKTPSDWITRDNGWEGIITKGDFDVFPYAYRLGRGHSQNPTNRTVSFGVAGGGKASTPLQPDRWYHVTGTYDSAADQIKIYINGELNGTGGGGDGPIDSISDDLVIGANRVRLDAEFFKGTIDEVMIWERALSAGEISSLYDASATQYQNTFSSLADGKHNFTGYAVDINGNKNQTEERQVTIDATAPGVTINFPVDGEFYTTSDLPLIFNVTLSEVGSVQYSLDGGINRITMSTTDGLNFDFSNNSIADGDYVFRVYASDAIGNTNNTETATLKFDTTPPVINFLEPPTEISGTTIDESVINISVAVSDLFLNNITIRLYDSLHAEIRNSFFPSSGGIVSVDYTTDLPDGVYYFNASATDKVGLTSDTETRTITIDVVPPFVDFEPPTPDNGTIQNNRDIFVNISSSDEIGGHYTFNDVNRDLKLWMRFDDVNGIGEPLDKSTWSNNGLLLGDTFINTGGKFGKAGQFDGAGDFVSISNSASLDFDDKGNYTWAFWVKLNELNREHRILFKGTSGSDSTGYILGVKGDNTVAIGTPNQFSGDGFLDKLSTVQTLNADTFYHIAITFNTENDLKIYIDGVENVMGSSSAFNDDLTTDLFLGYNNLNLGINGTIDDVLIFDRALSVGEVKSLYDASVVQYQNNFTDLEEGIYIFRGHAVDLAGNTNPTEEDRVITIASLPPTVTLISPTNGSSTINRSTQIFVWNGVDPDGEADIDSYEFNISLVGVGGTCTDTRSIVEGISLESYTLQSPLNCFYFSPGEENYYEWSVRANDSVGFGPWSETWTLNVTPYVDIFLNTNAVDFGTLGPSQSNDTTNNSPPPFELENLGNSLVNITINASSLWTDLPNPTSLYEYKIRIALPGVYNLQDTTLVFTPMPEETRLEPAITEFNYSTGSDKVNIDLRITVPQGEAPGPKNSSVTLIATFAE